MALVGRVFGSGFQHHRGEHAHAMGHAHEVDAQHPFPVLEGVFPDQAPCPHARVVEHKVRCAKARQRRCAQGFHLVGLGYVDLYRQHLGTGGLHLRHGLVQRVLLHIGQHQVHSQLCAYAGAFQAKAGASTGEDGSLVLEIGNHAFAFLRM